MKDEVRLEKILRFCEKPRKAKEIMLEITQSENVAYKCIRELRADGYLKKIQDFSQKNDVANYLYYLPYLNNKRGLM